MEWTEETIARLRGLWAEGLSTAEIGRRLGVSKNAVVGKAHRLVLPPRPSPIRRGGTSVAAPRKASPRRMAGPTLPPLASHPGAVRPQPETARAEAAASPSPVRPVPAPRSRSIACCWPIGEPGTSSFRFCDADATSGKPYCAAHASVAYVKVRDRREDAA